MVGQRHRGVADAGREELDQPRGDRAVDERDQDHEPGAERDHHRVVDLRHVGLRRIARAIERAAQLLAEVRRGGLEGCGLENAALERGHRDGGRARADAHRGRGARGRGLVAVGHARLGERGLGDIAGFAEGRLADRVELQAAAGRVCDHHHRRGRHRALQRRVRVVRDRLERREIGERREQAARHHQRLAADAVRERAEHHEERRADEQRGDHDQVGRGRLELQRALEEEQGVELPRVPHHRLPGGGAEEGQQHDLEVAALGEGLGQRLLGELALGADLLEGRRLLELQPDIDRHGEQHHRHQERDAPAPDLEGVAGQPTAHQDHEQREEEPHRRRGLDPAGVEPAPAFRRVLGDIGGGAAVFTAEREALQHAQQDEDDGRRHADGGVARQQADQCGRHAHQHDGDEEGALAADEVAEPPEHQRAEGPHEEARREGEQSEDEARGLVDAREELLGDDDRQRAVEEEVVPLEHRPQGRGEDHPAVGGVDTGGVCGGAARLGCGHDAQCALIRRGFPNTPGRRARGASWRGRGPWGRRTGARAGPRPACGARPGPCGTRRPSC